MRGELEFIWMFMLLRGDSSNDCNLQKSIFRLTVSKNAAGANKLDVFVNRVLFALHLGYVVWRTWEIWLGCSTSFTIDVKLSSFPLQAAISSGSPSIGPWKPPPPLAPLALHLLSRKRDGHVTVPSIMQGLVELRARFLLSQRDGSCLAWSLSYHFYCVSTKLHSPRDTGAAKCVMGERKSNASDVSVCMCEERFGAGWGRRPRW